MWGRLVVGLIVGCVVAWCADPGRSQPAATAPVCGPEGAQTLAADAVARVYSHNQTVYGCALPGGQSITLGSTDVHGQPSPDGPFALAGAIVAYDSTFHGVDTASSVVIVRRLTDGQTLGSYPALTAALGPETFTIVGSVVVKADGAVAWIGVGSGILTHLKRTQVFRATGARQKLLDHSKSRAIVADSLRLHGSRLTWKHGGKIRSGRLR